MDHKFKFKLVNFSNIMLYISDKDKRLMQKPASCFFMINMPKNHFYYYLFINKINAITMGKYIII